MLHLLTDTHRQQRWTAAQLVAMAAAEGVDVVQYRDKHLAPAAQVAQVQAALQRIPPGSPTRLVVNDHLSVALAAGAHGVHVGQGDDAPDQALLQLPPGSLVGATVHNEEELAAVLQLPLSYIGVGPVFGTTSKNTGLPPLGIVGLRHLCNLSPFPVIAIGSITAARISQVMDAGAHGVAILSDYCLAPHPQAAAAAFLRALAPYRPRTA